MSNVKVSIVCLANILSLLIFLYGYFPIQSKYAHSPKSSTSDSFSAFYDEIRASNCSQLNTWIDTRAAKRPLVENLVLIVIDALRYDFIFTPSGEANGRMEFLTNVIHSGNAQRYKAVVQPPTVTMPRIKAITGGVVPTFADVVLNFASSAFVEDNLISLAKNNGRRLLFYGDDTWLRLFPAHFQDSDGVTSFVVTDYTEVDDNVTRHLDKALDNAKEWDMMVLHYLGLDHIGHTSGPTSPLIGQKLKEMDGVINKIFSKLKEGGRSFSIILLGDHGMTDVGSHGGASPYETTVPLVAVAGSSRKSHQGVPPTVQQVDVTPTIARLLALPIPVNNLGIVLLPVIDLSATSAVDEIELIRENAAQMLRLFRLNADQQKAKKAIDEYGVISSDFKRWIRTEFCSGIDDSIAHVQLAEGLRDRYRRLAEEIRAEIITSLVSYNDAALVFGVVVMFVTTVLSFRACYPMISSSLASGSEATRPDQFLFFGCLLHTLSFGSSSFIEEEHETWYFILTTYVALCLVNALGRYNRANEKPIPWQRILLHFGGPLILCRVVRSWNRAGIKWRHLECFADWIIQSQSPGTQLFIVCVSTVGSCVVAFQSLNRPLQRILIAACCTFIIGYRLNVFSPFWNLATVRTVYFVSALFLLLRRWFAGTLLLVSLLVKPMNAPLIFMTIILQKLVTTPFSSSTTKSPLELICSTYFVAMVSYFALGNSNSIGHVDVASGFVGVSAYSPFINGSLIIIHLYAGPLIACCAGMIGACTDSWSRNSNSWLFVILSLKGLPTAFYLLIAYLQRHHLFIWSVFAPKLLYECLHMAVISVFVLLVQIFKIT